MKFVKTYEQLNDFHQMGEPKYYLVSKDDKYVMLQEGGLMNYTSIDDSGDTTFPVGNYMIVVEIEGNQDYILGNQDFEQPYLSTANKIIKDGTIENQFTRDLDEEIFLMDILDNKYTLNRTPTQLTKYYKSILKNKVNDRSKKPIEGLSSKDFKVVEYNVGMMKKTKLNI